tara:strand:- start:2330 stop:3208 length:879 start_codon:yes stop_codon:yes gene_type:complete
MKSKRNIYIHADDYGLTKGISKSLDQLIDDGKINSISIIVNGYEDFEYTLDKEIRIASHINIFENKPVSDKKSLSNIVNDKGYFRESFIFYLFIYYFSFGKKRQLIKSQIYKETESQLNKLIFILDGSHKINSIDSHNHIHMIPFIFDIFIEICLKHDIKNIRTTHEFFDLSFPKKNLFKFNFYVGIIKHILLNLFTYINLRKVKKNNLSTNKYFIGVLFSGRMSKKLILSSIKKIQKKLEKNDYIETVLHPGIADINEHIFWENSPSLSDFYTSKNRLNENITLNNIDDIL